MKCKPTSNCPKSGIKIHASNNDPTPYMDQLEFYNRLKEQNKHTGVRIEKSNNEYESDPFGGLNPFKSNDPSEKVNKIVYSKNSYDFLDLNIDNYSRPDLYKLFGLNNSTMLTEDIMREAKKLVLKSHPDKSQLDPKYFLFFSKAYKRLYGIYEFQNKSTKKEEMQTEYGDVKEQGRLLNNMFEKKKELKDPSNFNKWFNDQFEKYKIDDETKETGYGDWLKSDEGVYDVGMVSKANMAAEFEKQKKAIQSLTVYNGVNDLTASSFGGSTLLSKQDNFSSGELFGKDSMGYTDLRQAYVESIIPVTEEDYQKIPKFKNVNEYKTHRETVESKPLSKEEAMRQLYMQNKQKDEESAALAFHYAREAEKAKKNNESFWSGLKQLTNW
jgi:hypothetical protein